MSTHNVYPLPQREPSAKPVRLPPHNTQAEQALLGALLSNNQAIERVGDGLKAEHFAIAEHGHIYAAIRRRYDAGETADAITLHAEFRHSGLLEPAGGVAYLAELLCATVGIINAGEYARLIEDCWRRRQLITACEAGVSGAYGDDPALTTTAVVEALENDLQRIAESMEDDAPLVGFGQAVEAAVTGGREALERGAVFHGLSSGYRALDRMLCGMAGGELILLGARPSMGKTSLGLGIATRVAALLRDDNRAQHKRVLLWSGEMSAVQLGARGAAAHAGLSVASVFTHRQMGLPEDAEDRRPPPLDRWQVRDLERATREAYALPLVVDDRAGITPQRLRTRARRLHRAVKAGGLALIVVDYVGLMRGASPHGYQNKVQEMTEISAALKSLARELDVPVLALSQLNRAVEGREDKTPQMSDLRESGSLEQDADKILFLHRSHYYLSRAVPTRSAKETDEAHANKMTAWSSLVASSKGKADIIVAKNRQGPTGRTEVRFNDTTVWFRDESEADSDPAWWPSDQARPDPEEE